MVRQKNDQVDAGHLAFRCAVMRVQRTPSQSGWGFERGWGFAGRSSSNVLFVWLARTIFGDRIAAAGTAVAIK